MKTEIVEFEDAISGKIYRSVMITHEDGSFESFPVDDNNPRYQQYLIELDTDLPEPTPAVPQAPAESTITK